MKESNRKKKILRNCLKNMTYSKPLYDTYFSPSKICSKKNQCKKKKKKSVLRLHSIMTGAVVSLLKKENLRLVCSCNKIKELCDIVLG